MGYSCCYPGCCGSCCIPKLPPPDPDVSTPSKKSKDSKDKESLLKKDKAGPKTNGKSNSPRNPGGTDLSGSLGLKISMAGSTSKKHSLDGYPTITPKPKYSVDEMDSIVSQQSARKLAEYPSSSNASSSQ